MEPDDLVQAARKVAEEVLAPRAQETDRAKLVPRENLAALAAAGLFGLACPSPGRPPAPAPAMRAIQEAVAGACGATYFVWAQHHSPVRLLADSANAGPRQRWLGPLCQGQALAGVAFAYLRRPGPPAVSAVPTPGGWRVSGTAPFVTSWGLADVFLVVGTTPEDHLVWFCLEGRATEAVRPSPPLPLAVLQATGTVQLALDQLLVPEGDVVAVELAAAWRRRDRLATPQPSSAALGVADRCCRLLAEMGPGRTGEAAEALAAELARCRERAYGLADALPAARAALPVDTAAPAGPGGHQQGPTGAPASGDDGLASHLEQMVAARAWGLDLAQRASLALVAAVGGGAMLLTHPAQRLAREAMFYAVQAQTTEVRHATLALLS